ncbi:MAG: ADP-ribosylglycohydrolase family protein [Spirochaetota bacterium]
MSLILPAAREARVRAFLEAFAVGDALGMPTEFMTRAEILSGLAGGSGLVEDFVEPSRSRNHSNLERGRITDDTEQNLWLLDAWQAKGSVSAENTAKALLAWVVATGAVEKRYIGPSSMAALASIEKGADPRTTGLMGRTCGGIMRAPAGVIFAMAHGLDAGNCVLESCIPTHFTSTALEAAFAYARALEQAFVAARNQARPALAEAVLEAARAGAAEGAALAPYRMCAPSLAARMAHLATCMPALGTDNALLDFLGDVYGTGLESVDVAAAVFGIFMRAGTDVWLAVRMGASVGGDTDTIAALAGGLCAAFAGGHNIPDDKVQLVASINSLDFAGLARRFSAAVI